MLIGWKPCFKWLRCCVQRRNYCEGTLPLLVTNWLEDMCEMLHPKNMHICDGSIDEREVIIQELAANKVITKMNQQNNSFLVRSDMQDTGIDESRVFTAAYSRVDFMPTPAECFQSCLGNFMHMSLVDEAIKSRFKKAMKGKKMFVVPFLLGPLTGDHKIIGIQITDSGLAALFTLMMTRWGPEALTEMHKIIGDETSKCSLKFLKLVHATGCEPSNPPHWQFNREKYMIINMPEKGEVWSYGSSYWENSFLVKNFAAVQLASYRGKKEKYLVAKMSVMNMEDPCGNKYYFGIMGPPGSGKSVMAAQTGGGGNCPVRLKMLNDDVSWLTLSDSGCFSAINPEVGIFPLVKGISRENTPSLMDSICSNGLALNTGSSGTDNFWWEGVDMPDKDKLDIVDWRGKAWLPDGPRAAHLDARFITSIMNVPNLDPGWETACGIPLNAIIILTRRSEGFPLIMEMPTWSQTVFHLASLRTRYHNQPMEVEDVHWEPFGIKKYLGFNLGKMIDLWLNMENIAPLPRTFIVNLFLMDKDAKEYIWPGYEANRCLIKWVLKRILNEVGSDPCPVGYLPLCSDMEIPCNLRYPFDSLMPYSQEFWQNEISAFETLLSQQMPNDIPRALSCELNELKKRVTPDSESLSTS